MERLHAYLLSAVMLGATAYPAFLDPTEDGFPLSTYPMFSKDRGAVVPIASASAVGGGGRVAVAPRHVANAEVMQALQTIAKAVRHGKRASRKLCGEIAGRIAEAEVDELASPTHVEIATEKHASIAFLAGERTPRGRRVHARCAIPGRGAP